MLAPQSECFTNIVQDFLVCTTIHKAHQLGVFQSSLYVRVALDKKTRRTRSYDNSENPYFNEYFVFELKCSLMELLRMTILYEVKKQTACKKNPILGELLIDLQSVWDQPNRCYFKKWGPLEVPLGQIDTSETGETAIGTSERGFLQIDLAIVSQASNISALLRPYEEDSVVLNKWHINQDYDDIEKNLLQNVDADVRCNIRYTVTFYRGIMSRKSDYLIQFRFHPFKGRTNVAKNTQSPVWNQEICFVWSYPSLAQTFVIQLLMHEHLQWKCMAEYELHFNEIAFNDKPSLGPTFINLYDNINGSHYVGCLLLAIKSECLEAESHHALTFKKILPLEEKRYWEEEEFLIEFLLLQGDFVHCSGNSCKIAIKLADHQSNFIECRLKNYPTSLKKDQLPLNSCQYFVQTSPLKSITLEVNLPDNRFKFEGDVYLQEIVEFIRTEMELFNLFQIQYTGHSHSQLKVLRNILGEAVRKLELSMETERFAYTNLKEVTQWDANRLVYLKDFAQKLLDNLKSQLLRLKPSSDHYVALMVDEVVALLVRYCNELQHLLLDPLLQAAWPSLILILNANNKEIGFCRLSAKSFLYPSTDREPADSSSQCWKIKNFIFKDMKCQHTCTNCGCTVAIIRGCLSIVTKTQASDFLSHVVKQWKHPEPFYWSPHIPFVNFKCRVFIHQAKIRPGADRSGLCDPYVRAMVCRCAAETAILFSTLSPVWNTVLSFDNIKLPGNVHWYLRNPPLVAIEVYDTDRKTADDYLGCGVLSLSVLKSNWPDSYARASEVLDSIEGNNKRAIQKYELLKYLSPPPLKWVPIALRGAIRAEVLLSAELVEAEEGADAQPNEECKANVTVGIPSAIRPNMKNFVLEVVFVGFRKYRKQNLLTRKHRVKLMLGDLVLNSGLTTSPIKKSMNFLILYNSGVVSLPDQLEYWPAIIATDVAVSSKSEETTLGATLIANTRRYLQKEQTIACSSIKKDKEIDRFSTSIELESESESENENESQSDEEKPLIRKQQHESYLQNVLKKVKPFNQESKQTQQIVNFREVIDESEYNWWTKFYNSDFIEPSGSLSDLKHTLCIYPNELEKQPEFSYFHDWADTFNMVHGIKYKKNALPKEEIYASLKLSLKITPCFCERSSGSASNSEMLRPLATALNPRYQAQVQSLAELVKVTIRVYIVQGLQLRPSVKKIQADSYVKVQLGQGLATNRAEYIPHESNPIFGKCFQLEGLLPREHILEVSLFNRKDLIDETIGATSIDLEDRWRSKHRATVGIANEYSSSGYNKWNDHLLPSEILSELCRNNDVRPPKIKGDVIEVDGVSFQDETEIATSEDLKERLCLTALKHCEDLPSFGYKLVPQHVETRSLYRSEGPGIEQGKIQLWIELFDGNLNIPPPINITPTPPELYELRVIIYNVADVVLQEENIFGTAMSDIYIKGCVRVGSGWCSSFNDAQVTDVHYRSMNGEGNFNWRMLFPLKYSKIEDMMVTKRCTALLEEYELKQPPTLHLQIWDNDFISPDDFLGSLEINLSAFPEPYETAKKCELLDVAQSITSYGSTIRRLVKSGTQRRLVNLFKRKKVRGWFPMRGNLRNSKKSRQIGLAGKIELELEMLTESEATFNPVGLGRYGLEMPNRPESSFNPFARPWKGTEHILLPKILKFLFILIIVCMAVAALVQIITKLPLIMAGLGY